MLTPEAAPLLRALLELTGQAEPVTVSYATDAGWLQTLGVECVVFGPGDIAVAHRANEHVPVADLAGARALERAIERFCGAVAR